MSTNNSPNKEKPLKITRYLREKTILLLSSSENNCRPDKVIQAQNSFKIGPNQIDSFKEFINTEASKAQNNVNLHMNNSEPFTELNNWANLFKDAKIHEENGNEIPFIFQMIANTDDFPESQGHRVDFK